MPAFVRTPVTVHAPASSANLGPGFDSFAIALTTGDQIIAQVADGGLAIDVDGEGAREVPRDENHLVVRSMRAAFDLLGGQPDGLDLRCHNVIAHGRGLGSSAAAIVGGIVAARALVVGGEGLLGDDAVLSLATRLEGHPDNVAAALFGGLTLAWTGTHGAHAVRLDARTDVCCFVPSQAVATELARGLLPDQVPHSDAARNAGRAGLLVAALTGRPDLLLVATQDWLHQDYRAPAFPASHALLTKLRLQSVAAVISGAGPAVLAFGHGHRREDIQASAPEGWETLWLTVDPRGTRIVGTERDTSAL